MKRIPRHIANDTLATARQFRAVCIVGPRQSGKTTLSRMIFGNKPYVSFENPTTESEAISDTEAFLKQYEKGAIFDEVQRMPNVFRYFQGILDASGARGRFILTGSNNLSQTLAGRVGYLELLPLSYGELKDAKLARHELHKIILTGGYPEIWQQKLDATKWMASYVQTYVQRDVRLLRNISNLGLFNRFIQLCANHAGQVINKDSLAKATGVDSKTVTSWLAVLESSYILYLLQPYHDNLNKRVIKSPKLYFYDTGLLCYLLGIHTEAVLKKHPKFGLLFENWIISEVKKNHLNRGIKPRMYFFRDSAGNEVDLLLEKEGEPIAIEIKSGTSFNREMLGGLRYWAKYNQNKKGILLYRGEPMDTENGLLSIMNWKEVAGF